MNGDLVRFCKHDKRPILSSRRACLYHVSKAFGCFRRNGFLDLLYIQDGHDYQRISWH